MSTRLPACLLLAVCALSAQQTFDVASIKPNADNDDRVMIGLQPGGRFNASGVTLKHLISHAYNIPDHLISGGPGWMDSARFDINAKAEGVSERMSPDELRSRLKALLEERFGLKARIETKNLPVYALVVGKNGHKLTKSAPMPEVEAPGATPTSRPLPPQGVRPAGPGGMGRGAMIRIGRGTLSAAQMPMAILARSLSQMLSKTVLDKTGLDGAYEVKLEWAPEPGQRDGPFGGPPPPDAVAASDTGGPTIFTALQEQLGLKLESTTGPVETLVVDKVEKPTEN